MTSFTVLSYVNFPLHIPSPSFKLYGHTINILFLTTQTGEASKKTQKLEA